MLRILFIAQAVLGLIQFCIGIGGNAKWAYAAFSRFTPSIAAGFLFMVTSILAWYEYTAWSDRSEEVDTVSTRRHRTGPVQLVLSIVSMVVALLVVCDMANVINGVDQMTDQLNSYMGLPKGLPTGDFRGLCVFLLIVCLFHCVGYFCMVLYYRGVIACCDKQNAGPGSYGAAHDQLHKNILDVLRRKKSKAPAHRPDVQIEASRVDYVRHPPGSPLAHQYPSDVAVHHTLAAAPAGRQYTPPRNAEEYYRRNQAYPGVTHHTSATTLDRRSQHSEPPPPYIEDMESGFQPDGRYQPDPRYYSPRHSQRGDTDPRRSQQADPRYSQDPRLSQGPEDHRRRLFPDHNYARQYQSPQAEDYAPTDLAPAGPAQFVQSPGIRRDEPVYARPIPKHQHPVEGEGNRPLSQLPPHRTSQHSLPGEQRRDTQVQQQQFQQHIQQQQQQQDFVPRASQYDERHDYAPPRPQPPLQQGYPDQSGLGHHDYPLSAYNQAYREDEAPASYSHQQQQQGFVEDDRPRDMSTPPERDVTVREQARPDDVTIVAHRPNLVPEEREMTSRDDGGYVQRRYPGGTLDRHFSSGHDV